MTAPKNKKSAQKRPASTKSARLTTSTKAVERQTPRWLPKLVHHRHSFKLLPHRHTSYPLLFFGLLLVGIFSIGWTAFASGDVYDGGSYLVNAVVPAPPLPVAAQITYPSDGDVFHGQIITVTGTCPSDSYVKLYNNRVFSGTGLCQSNGNWYIQTSLSLGANKLFARDYNVTDQAGPISTAITVTYDPPQATKPSETSGGTSLSAAGTSTAAPLVLSSEYTYQGVYAGQAFNEAFSLAGGTAPYAVSIDWGDGSTDLSSHTASGNFTMQHTYQQPGDYRNSYIIVITATDAAGQTSLLQMIAIVTPAQTGNGPSGLHIGGTTGGTSMSDGSGGAESPYAKFWHVAAPVYGLAFVGLSSFWLGESREFELLRQHAVRLHRRRPLR